MRDQDGQPGAVSSSVDGYAEGVVGLVDSSALGVSTDVLLFSDIHLSLVHHYRIHKRGLPHIAFRINYLYQLRAVAVAGGPACGWSGFAGLLKLGFATSG